MSVWGKVLAVLNLLAAGGFVYLAMMDYDQRRTWAYHGLKQNLIAEGVPVDASVTDIQNVPLVEALDPGSLKRIQQMGGQPLKTQEEELKRVQNEVQKRIDDDRPLELKDPVQEKARQEAEKLQRVGGPDALKLRQLLERANAVPANPNAAPAAPAGGLVDDLMKKRVKLQKLAYMLRPFATTFVRRDGLTRLMAASLPLPPVPLVFDEKTEKELFALRAKQAAKKNRTAEELAKDEDEYVGAVIDKLQSELEGEFTQAQQRKNPDEKRAAITHVLFCTDEALAGEDDEGAKAGVLKSKDFQRTLAIVGLEAAIHELNTQTPILEHMAYEEELAIERDRSGFTLEHDKRLRQIGALKEYFQRTENDRKAKERERDVQAEVVRAQRENVARIQTELNTARQETQRLLADQSKREQQILEQQRALRVATAKLLEMERRLADLEAKVSPKGEAQ